LDFLQGAYNDELIGRFDGLAHVELVPGIVTWAHKSIRLRRRHPRIWRTSIS
jgi:hypothetical protein